MQTQTESHRPTRPEIDRADVERLPALRPGFCDQCRNRLPASKRKHHARFCSAACRPLWGQIAAQRGAKLYQHLLIWRRYRGRKDTPGQGVLGLLSNQVDAWLRERKDGQTDQETRRGNQP